MVRPPDHLPTRAERKHVKVGTPEPQSVAAEPPMTRQEICPPACAAWSRCAGWQLDPARSEREPGRRARCVAVTRNRTQNENRVMPQAAHEPPCPTTVLPHRRPPASVERSGEKLLRKHPRSISHCWPLHQCGARSEVARLLDERLHVMLPTARSSRSGSIDDEGRPARQSGDRPAGALVVGRSVRSLAPPASRCNH